MPEEPPDRVLTIPNLISVIRLGCIPVFLWLLFGQDDRHAAAWLLAVLGCTDWVDGYIARHTGQVSNLGKLLDPVADRLAITAALLAMVARDAFPLWAALLVIVRDGLILIAGVVLLAAYKVRLDVRWIGKAATFGLMVAIPLIAWGNFGLYLHTAARVVGWGSYWPAIVLYYGAAAVYAVDVTAAIRTSNAG